MNNPVVQINHIDTISWNNADQCRYKLNNTADIWSIKINSHVPFIDDLWPLLNTEEHSRANRYYHEKDKHRFIISRGYLKILLGKYLDQAPEKVMFEIGENKKPFIKNNTSGLYYNVSHSGNCILIAIALSEIGVDVEHVDTGFPYIDVLPLTFSSPEINYVQRSDSPVNFFYRLWTRKEALLKATAKGIDDNLPLIPCLDGFHQIESNVIGSGKNWSVSSFKIDEHHTASVASQSNPCLFWSN